MPALVEVYWNLRKGCYSIREQGRVTLHATHFWLRDVVFRVQPAGRDKVRATGHKNVHAYVKGEITLRYEPAARRVFYNPQHDDHFRLEDGTPIHEAPFVTLHPEGKIYVP